MVLLLLTLLCLLFIFPSFYYYYLRRPNTWNGNQPVNLNMLASTSVN